MKRPAARRRSRLSVGRAIRRACEVFLGLILFAGLVSPAALVFGGVLELIKPTDFPRWAIALLFIGGLGLGWFCIVTGWRLITGHEQPGGGLLHPWFLYAAAFGGIWYATSRSLMLGPEFGDPHHRSARHILEMARARRQQQRSMRRPFSVGRSARRSAHDTSRRSER